MYANVVICMQRIVRHSCAALKAVRYNYTSSSNVINFPPATRQRDRESGRSVDLIRPLAAEQQFISRTYIVCPVITRKVCLTSFYTPSLCGPVSGCSDES